ncbi:MAG: hypothetical protein P8P14_03220 [Porticoccaceae bacterium]|nr:hypothetical protein [Porticoccaceae bacterium]MDG1081369.1 hypothetical protein [Porticoccaceae bacterium]
MKLQFLCGNHRLELERNLSKAMQIWKVGTDTGQFYRDHMLWLEAIPHLGCAFETAEILLSNITIDHRNACERFSDTALLLSSTFKNAIRIADAEDVIWVTINRLEKELSANLTNTAWINHHLANQYKELKRTLITNQHLIRPTKRHSSNLEPAGLLH